MNSERHIQTAGARSRQFQSGRDLTIYQGISVEEARQISLGVFWENFPKLTEEAKLIVQQRISDFLAHLESQSDQTGSETINSLADPAVQNTMIEAMRASAVCIDDRARDLLARIFVARSRTRDRTDTEIAAEQAIAAVSKLSLSEMDLLTLIRGLQKLTRETVASNRPELSKFLKSWVTPHLHLIDKHLEERVIQLQCVGCVVLAGGNTALEERIARTRLYNTLVPEGPIGPDPYYLRMHADLNLLKARLLEIEPALERALVAPQHVDLVSCDLTRVGILIADMNRLSCASSQ